MTKRMIVCVGIDPLTTHALREYFSAEFEFLLYESAERFSTSAQQRKMSLIFLNSTLPDMTSLQDFCIALRSLPATETVPIMILSDQPPEPKEKYQLFATGLIDGYFTTPLNVEELAAYANVFLQRQNLQEELEEKNRLLAEMSVTDELMGIYNRRFLMQRLNDEVERIKRYHHPLAAMMLDIDYFKKINDEWGHRHGDIILKELALVLKESIRPMDAACRYGGEEIIVICPHTNFQGAMIMAERVRTRIKERTFSAQAHPVRLSISIGLVCCDQYRDITTDRLIQVIDKQLYTAKKEGRDCVRGILLSHADASGSFQPAT